MVSMPILATSATQSRGPLSVLLKTKAESGGCAHEVLSGQLVDYLERADVEERSAALVRRLPAATVAPDAAVDGNGAEHELGSIQLPAVPETFTATADTKALEEHRAAIEAAVAAAEAKFADQKRAAEQAVRAAAETRAAEEQRAVQAAAEAKALEERRIAAETTLAAAEAKFADRKRAAEQAAAEAKAIEERVAAAEDR